MHNTGIQCSGTNSVDADPVIFGGVDPDPYPDPDPVPYSDPDPG